MNYTAKETVISSIINTLFSIVFFVGLFRNEPELIFGGTSALTMDFLPQAFFVGLFAALPSSLLTLKRIKAGTITPVKKKRPPLPRSLPVRIICLALGSLLLFGGGPILIFNLLDPIQLSFLTVLMLKALYGIVITIVITPLAVNYLMSGKAE